MNLTLSSQIINPDGKLRVLGYVCECGIRGGYFEAVNIDPEVKSVLQASIAAKLCPTVLGQVRIPFEKNSSSSLLLEF